jgi:hypothetical protein
MHTEDDTFRVLSRASVPEMLSHYADWVSNGNGQFDDLEEMCARHGWTWKDFSIVGADWRETHRD